VYSGFNIQSLNCEIDFLGILSDFSGLLDKPLSLLEVQRELDLVLGAQLGGDHYGVLLDQS
jgi:hypothetical protein